MTRHHHCLKALINHCHEFWIKRFDEVKRKQLIEAKSVLHINVA